MDATADKVLYVWIQGDPYRAPEIRMMAAPAMNLARFLDRHVDTARGYLIIRVGQVCDQPVQANQDCIGQRYQVTLTPVGAEFATGMSLVSTQEAPPISLTAIKGIGRRYAALLHEKANINSVQELLAAGASRQDRDQLEAQTGLSSKLILRWVQLADLMRVDGIGSDYSQLLWETGITSMPDLALQKPRSLLNALTRVKVEQGGVHRLPYLEQVTDWIRQASSMEPAVTS
jgi:predicted flap endonuclease-1-like 5' DNA nuclease